MTLKSIANHLVVVLICLLVLISNSAEIHAASTYISTVHRQRVPHTDKNGRPLQQFEPSKSFFPIGIWGMVLPDGPDGKYIGWDALAKANFNTVWPTNWDDQALALAQDAGLQVVYMGSIASDTLSKIKDHPNLLANMWTDEPTGRLGQVDMDALFKQFQDYKKNIAYGAPGLPVFINDPPAIYPSHREWWLKWNTAGDISCQDIYPLVDRKSRTRSLGADPDGMPQVVSLAVEANKDSKPVWTIVDAFQHPHDRDWPYRMPTPTQMRAQVYTAIVSGATGIAYFTFDSWPNRTGGIVGMSPDPKPSYRENAPAWTLASPILLIQAKALWETTRLVNSEIRELTPSLLSPTVGEEFKYSVDVKGDSVTPAPLRCMLKPDTTNGSGYILIMVNVDDAVLDSTVTMPVPMRSIEVLFENRVAPSAEANGAKFSDVFEPFDTHVYRIRVPQDVPRVRPK